MFRFGFHRRHTRAIRIKVICKLTIGLRVFQGFTYDHHRTCAGSNEVGIKLRVRDDDVNLQSNYPTQLPPGPSYHPPRTPSLQDYSLAGGFKLFNYQPTRMPSLGPSYQQQLSRLCRLIMFAICHNHRLTCCLVTLICRRHREQDLDLVLRWGWVPERWPPVQPSSETISFRGLIFLLVSQYRPILLSNEQHFYNCIFVV